MSTIYKCRLCLSKTSKKVDIFKDDFPKMIQLLSGIKVDPNDGLLKTSCLECAKDVKFCMSVRKQILKSHKFLVEELWNTHGIIYSDPVVKSAISRNDRNTVNKSNITKKTGRKRENSPDSLSEDDQRDEYSEYSDNDLFSDDKSADSMYMIDAKTSTHLKNESATTDVTSENVLEEITVIHDVQTKFETKNEFDSSTCDNVELESIVTNVKSEDSLDSKELSSISTQKRLLNKRNMIAASNRILNQPNSVKDKRYSNVIFIRKSRREKLEKKNQKKLVTPKKEKKEDPNVIIKNGKKYAACEICKREVKKHYMKYHMTTHFPKHFSCDICGATTRNLRGLRYHKLYWHSSKLDYICDKCGKKYRSKHALDLHNKKEHGGIRDLECNICGKKFFQKMHLKRHVDGIHKKLRPHKCEYCGKDFTKRTHLVTHWRTHTNETPYGCDMCGERFKLKLSLKNHLKRVHNFEEEEKVFCNICNRGFATEQGLRAHINSRVHEGQKCQYCSEIFTPEYLKTHLRDVHFHVDYF